MTDKERSAGRPRDLDAGPALQEAARRLVRTLGYDNVSIAMIATEAGVGRQTLYRRWQSKAELVLEAFLESASRATIREQPADQEPLSSFLKDLFLNLAVDGPAIRHLIASAQSDPAFLNVFRENFVRPRAAVARAIFLNLVERGEIAPDADIDMAIDALHGAFWYRLLQDEPLDDAFAERLARLLIAACHAR